MAKYVVETDQGKFEIETEDPTPDGPDFLPVGEEKSFEAVPFLESPVRNIAQRLSNKIITDPKGSTLAVADALPAVGGTVLGGGAALTGYGIPAAAGLTGLGAAGGEAARQIIRRYLGEDPTPKVDVPVPFVDKQLPRIPGVSPEVSNIVEQAGANTAVQGAVSGIAKAAPYVAKPLGKIATKVGKAFSGVPEHEYRRLFKDPEAILPGSLGGPAKSVEEAGQALGEATKGMRVSASVDPLPRSNQALKAASDKVLKDVPVDLSQAQQIETIKTNVDRLTPQETYEAYRDVRDLLKSAVEGKNKELTRIRVIWKQALQDRLGRLSGEYSEASKGFAKSALRDTFRQPFPLTKYGQSSIGRAGFSAPLLGPLGYAAGGPVGAVAASLLGTSPIVHGAVTAGAGAAAKAAGAAARVPGFVQSMAAAAREMRREKKGKRK